MTKDNIIDRDQLQDDYINRVIDGLDIKDLIALVYDQLDHNLDSYSCEELIEEVNEHYPDLLEQDDVNISDLESTASDPMGIGK
jgi:hypothetical protein|tara:strand:+ start:8019 stop:8270 length:252 start_codon:yes stop_codon:yes gene_type:complete